MVQGATTLDGAAHEAASSPRLPRTLGDLAGASRLLPASMTANEIGRLFDVDPTLRYALLVTESRPGAFGLLTRLSFYRQMTGRLGFGFSLHGHRPASEIADWNPMVLPSTTPLAEVAAALLGEDRTVRHDDVVALDIDGTTRATPATAVFEALASLYAHQARHDSLTDLPNRAHFTDALQRAIERVTGGGAAAAVLFIDIDDFKSVNDWLGHEVGDRMLVEFGRRLRGVLKPTETLARFGGDEFAVLVEDVDDRGSVAAAARVEDALRAPFCLDGEGLTITASIGIVHLDAGVATTTVEVLRNADLAMYAAKRAGSGHQVFAPAMYERASRRRESGSDLVHAIERGQLTLVFQPQLDLRSGATIAAEALMRWRHPVHGLVPPAVFIPLAEETGLIDDLDAWALRCACLEMRRWRDSGLDIERVAVNVSARHCESGALLPAVATALANARLPAHHLELEVTESAAVSTRGRAGAVLGEIRALGVRIAIDDFGVGHSALSRLQDFPADALKIDRCFTASLGDGRRTRGIVAAIVALGDALDLDVIGEGVEAAAQAELLRRSGCGFGQGFHLGVPMAPELLEARLRAAPRARRGRLDAGLSGERPRVIQQVI